MNHEEFTTNLTNQHEIFPHVLLVFVMVRVVSGKIFFIFFASSAPLRLCVNIW